MYICTYLTEEASRAYNRNSYIMYILIIPSDKYVLYIYHMYMFVHVYILYIYMLCIQIHT